MAFIVHIQSFVLHEDKSKMYFSGMCNKMLDSTNVQEHERVLYCSKCHGRKFGPKGVGFGIGGGALSMDSGERHGNTEAVE